MPGLARRCRSGPGPFDFKARRKHTIRAVGWLYGTARHKAIDKLRSQVRMTAMAAALAHDEPKVAEPASISDEDVPDERLRPF